MTDDALLWRLAELHRGRRDGRRLLDVQNGAVDSGRPDIQVVVFAVRPDKAYGHAKGDPFGQTDYRF
ncbi:hypothetical protein AAH991_09615 [Microbispora sp. ZYX-F-249]|uniref:Uncharacterized protein n=1 Tax=Microbispora maris TaxID=3144104 RepID=A0ABV0ALB1_9ACTN